MAAVAAAAMIAAGMALFMVMRTVMIALDIGIIAQAACNKRLHRSVRIAGNTTVKLNARCRQSHLGTAADTAADQHIRLKGRQHTGQCSVAAAVGIHNL